VTEFLRRELDRCLAEYPVDHVGNDVEEAASGSLCAQARLGLALKKSTTMRP
jgi:hypothetical protein